MSCGYIVLTVESRARMQKNQLLLRSPCLERMKAVRHCSTRLLLLDNAFREARGTGKNHTTVTSSTVEVMNCVLPDDVLCQILKHAVYNNKVHVQCSPPRRGIVATIKECAGFCWPFLPCLCSNEMFTSYLSQILFGLLSRNSEA